MKSSKNTSSGHPILVSPDDLKHLEEFLKKHFTTITYSVTCEDGTKLDPTGLQDILDYENPTFRRIATVVIEASDRPASADRIAISLGKGPTFLDGTQSVFLQFVDIKKQQPIEEEVLQRLQEMRPWYWWLSRVPFKFVFPMALISMSFYLNAVSVIRKLRTATTAPEPPSRFTDAEGQVVTLATIVGLFFVGYIVDRFRDYLFPQYFFLLGRQTKDYERRKTISYTIFGVIVLGILINIMAAMIYQPR